MKNVDIHQLHLLCQLIDCQSLGAAAERLQMTSAAASQSLVRLRAAFPDDVYVRQGNAYVLTPYGERVIDGLRAIVRRWHGLEHAARHFDPSACEARFAVACVSHAATPDLVGLHEQFRRLAPLARLDLQVPLHNAVDLQALRAGTLDVLCASAPPPADARDLHHELLCTHLLTHVVCRRDHPRIGQALTLAGFLDEEHLVVHYRSLDPATRSPIDAALLARGLPMRRATYVQSLWTCVQMVARGEQLMTVSAAGALTLENSTPQLRSLPLPPGLPVLRTQLHMIWHERTHRSAAHRWLRERLRVAVQPAGAGEGGAGVVA
jgi:DNA-binding transcriptional LysR family regulator